ncbi:type VI secretion system contractile sheath large subunit [Paenochrobactrum glaciei]|uniref:Type VI secretion system contractile sheath large subunit n=2 Tax=Paenochrobactrum glaciei TaxID=486407 RepID=A0ABP3RP65_9HYPH
MSNSAHIYDKLKQLAGCGEQIIAHLDHLVNTQVNVILHAAQFIAMEARWRGLMLLAQSLPSSKTVRLKLLPANWAEIIHDCDRGNPEQTWLFEQIYNQEFALPGGEPFGLIIGDYTLGPSTAGNEQVVATLSVVASIMAAAFCPFIAGAAASCVTLTNYQELNRLPDLLGRIKSHEFIRWQCFRQREDARFIGLVAPRILLRNPYKKNELHRTIGFAFDEAVADDGATLCWGNAAFAFALNVMNNFIRHGWFAELHGIRDISPQGGYIDETLLEPYRPLNEIDNILRQPPVEIRLTTDQQQQFCAFGLIPVATSYLLEGIVFNTSQSLFLPPTKKQNSGHENLELSVMLQYVLCVSRFAHFLKIIMRTEIGKFINNKNLQKRLQDWLLTYTLAGNNYDPNLRARYPLRDCKVSIHEIAGRPGLFNCILDLQPYLNFDSLHASFRLIIDAPALAITRLHPAQSA